MARRLHPVHLLTKSCIFPLQMTIKVEGNQMSTTNLFGEKVPRIAPLPWSPNDVKVEVKNKSM